MKQKITIALSAFAALVLGWLLVLLLMRLGEWLLNGYQHQFPQQGASFFLHAALADLVLLGRISLLLLPVFLLLSLVSIKVARIATIVTMVLFSIGYFALQQYFLSTSVLLGADLYGYSSADIQQTVGASGGLNLITIAGIILIVALLILALGFAGKKIRLGFTTAGVLVVLLLLPVFVTVAGVRVKPPFEKEYDRNLSVNKLDYFLTASIQHFFPPVYETDIYSDVYSGDFGEGTTPASPLAFRYVDERNYPFLRADSTADVLSPFIEKGSTAPNIVVIMVEGLGRAFTNEGAYLGNFTPFLDSLSRQSLYWPNFLSGGGRTFAVLPSILGSAPFGKNGFNEMKDEMPDHWSLIRLLKQNGYATTFYSSGDASFDNMSTYLDKQGVDEVRDKKTFPAGYELMPANNGFTWGYGDRELYRYFIQSSNATPSKPTLSVMLTVSTHSPFLINNASYYDQLFEQRMTSPDLTETQKKEARVYKKQYLTVLYADDALRYLINEYRCQPAFANTVFFITGDHRMPEIPMASKIDRYHVPLIIYSPLITRPATFQSVSSHFDITPSIAAWLKQSWGIKSPNDVTWLGSGLDTTRIFRNIHSQALMQTKTDIIDFVQGEYHLNGDDLFRLKPGLKEEPMPADDPMKGVLKAGLEKFLNKNSQMYQTKKLMP